MEKICYYTNKYEYLSTIFSPFLLRSTRVCSKIKGKLEINFFPEYRVCLIANQVEVVFPKMYRISVSGKIGILACGS